MDTIYLHKELLDANERFFKALSTELHARQSAAVEGKGWPHRLRVARRELKSAAQHYAMALRTYRVALISQFAPVRPASPIAVRPASSHRRHASASAFSANRRHAGDTVRKEIPAEPFAVSSKRSKLQ
jgi:hypothetical protein